MPSRDERAFPVTANQKVNKSVMPDSPYERYFARLDHLSPQGNSFGFHIRYSRPLLARSTYADTWNANYSAKSYIIGDPSVIWGMLNRGAIRWSELQIPDTMGIFSDAALHGLVYGVVVAVGEQSSKTLGNCARADREFTDSEIREVEETVSSIHELLKRQDHLKTHQLSALQALAAGQTYEEACESLGISRTALRNRLSGARRVLGTASNSEAVRLAIEKGYLETMAFTGMAKGLPTTEEKSRSAETTMQLSQRPPDAQSQNCVEKQLTGKTME